MARLTPEQWQAIRTHWEYDPDEPSFEVAASRAAGKYQFQTPRRQSVHERAKKEAWSRKASLSSLNAEAHRRADADFVARAAAPDSGGGRPDAGSTPKPDAPAAQDPAAIAMAARDDEVGKRSAVITRHRQEWVNVAALRNEALLLRTTDPVRCSERMRQVKVMAEITAMQQAGERKAWAMDLMLAPGDMSNLSDEALEAIASGRLP